MNTKNKAYIAGVIIIIAAGVVFFMRGSSEQPPAVILFDGQAAAHALENSDRSVSPSEYVKRNITGLSGEAGIVASLGGTFQVTKIEAANGKGTVSYEDGHNAYSAEFAYAVDKKGLVSITAFSIKK